MADVRAELRAFPRLACAHPAVLEIGGKVEPCQVLDFSRGGCKIMPRALDHVASLDLRPHDYLTVVIGPLRIGARLAWATPNCSALGCCFDAELSDSQVTMVTANPAA
jgi:hypothetical protein